MIFFFFLYIFFPILIFLCKPDNLHPSKRNKRVIQFQSPPPMSCHLHDTICAKHEGHGQDFYFVPLSNINTSQAVSVISYVPHE